MVTDLVIFLLDAYILPFAIKTYIFPTQMFKQFSCKIYGGGFWRQLDY